MRLLAAIPFNPGRHLKYFTKDKEVWEEYHGYMIRSPAIFHLLHKEILCDHHCDEMDIFLRFMDSARTADWWKR